MAMDATDNKNYSYGWDNCPTEILFMVFKKLNIDTLITCMSVNKKWKEIADHLAQYSGLWPEIAQTVMVNKGASFKRKSKLNWHNLFINHQLWHHIHNSKVTMKLNFPYEVNDVRNIHVYRDKLIVICKSSIKYFNVDNHKLVKEFQTTCFDFEENDQMLMLVTQEVPYKKLRLRVKKAVEGDSEKESLDEIFDNSTYDVLHNNVTLYKLQDDCCYMVDHRNALWEIQWNKDEAAWNSKLLARYYGLGDISAINVLYDEVYIMLKWGDILHVDRGLMKFEKEFRINLLNYNSAPIPVMFDQFSVIVRVGTDEGFHISRYTGTSYNFQYIVLGSPVLTCAIQHGHVLFLGYKDASVHIYIRNNLKNDGVPDLRIDLHDYDKHLTDEPIVGIDVYEAKYTHHLFIATSSNVYHVQLAYPKSITMLL